MTGSRVARVALCLLLLTGCFRTGVDRGSGVATRNSDGSAVEVVSSKEDKIPEGLPDDFPVLDGQKIVYSVVANEGVTILAVRNKGLFEALTEIETALRASEWFVANCIASDGPKGKVVVITANKGDRFAVYTFTEEKIETGDFDPHDMTLVYAPEGNIKAEASRDPEAPPGTAAPELTPAPCPTS